jgi:multidrug resistance efflux pump
VPPGGLATPRGGTATRRDPNRHPTWRAPARADEAAVDLARLELAYCTIRALITGYAGRILIRLGNLVKANDANALVTPDCSRSIATG